MSEDAVLLGNFGAIPFGFHSNTCKKKKQPLILFTLTVACHGCTGLCATYCFIGDSSKKESIFPTQEIVTHTLFIYLLQLCQYVLKQQMHKCMTRYDFFCCFFLFIFFPVQGYFQNINLEGTNHRCVWSKLIRTPQVVMEQLLSAKPSWIFNSTQRLIEFIRKGQLFLLQLHFPGFSWRISPPVGSSVLDDQ